MKNYQQCRSLYSWGKFIGLLWDGWREREILKRYSSKDKLSNLLIKTWRPNCFGFPLIPAITLPLIKIKTPLLKALLKGGNQGCVINVIHERSRELRAVPFSCKSKTELHHRKSLSIVTPCALSHSKFLVKKTRDETLTDFLSSLEMMPVSIQQTPLFSLFLERF